MKRFFKQFAHGIEFQTSGWSVRAGVYFDGRLWKRLCIRGPENPGVVGFQVDISLFSIAIIRTKDRIID